MKKMLFAVWVAGVLLVGAAFAQVNTQPLQAQVQTVAKLVQMTEVGRATRSSNSIADYPYLFSPQQVQALLPYLREVRALTALTEADVAFYTQKIASILTDAQRQQAGMVGTVAVGASVPTLAGGGQGGTAEGSDVDVVANPMLEEGSSSALDLVITTLTQWESNFGAE